MMLFCNSLYKVFFFVVCFYCIWPLVILCYATAVPSLVAQLSVTCSSRYLSPIGKGSVLSFIVDTKPEVGARTQSGLGTGAIAGIVVAVILIVLITIDLFCCFFNSCGIIFCCHQAICGGGGAKGKDKYKDGKATEMEKKPLPENV